MDKVTAGRGAPTGGKKRDQTEKGGSRKEQCGGEMKTTRRDDMCMQKMMGGSLDS